MDLSGLPILAAAWLAAIAAFGATAAVAAVLLLRDLVRAEGHVASLEAEIERLHDRVFELSDSEERYRSLVDAQADYIVRRDDCGRITFANAGYASLVGAERALLAGTRQRPRVKEERVVRVTDGGTRVIDEAVETGDALRWISWTEVSVPTARGGTELQRVGRDVTDRVASERALQGERARAEAANEAKSRFLATVSHEIRTPLSGVLGMTDLLADTSLTPEQSTYVRALKTSGEALLSLIDGILDFCKIEAGKLELAADAFDLPAMVEGVVELLAPRAQGKGIEIASSIGNDVPSWVVGDDDRLRQVLMNLVGNAVKFTDKGGVGISVEREPEGRILFRVADTGAGIAPDRLPAIFREFEQADESASRRHGGTGLGLSISRRIVERMGGAIAVESELGQGSTFSFALDLPLAANQAACAAPQRPDLAGQRIVLVARSPFGAPFLSKRLAETNATVETYADVAAAEEALGRGHAHFLIADCALGEDAARRLAAAARRCGAGRTLVMLSPFERREFGSPADGGFDGYLVKPVRARSLFERLSAPAPGATVKPPQPEPAQSPPAPRCTRPGVFHGCRVLLAEDNEINALLALKTLQHMGATTDWAHDGAEAVAMVEATLAGQSPRYDLLLMDVRMPGLDGLEATRRIRAVEMSRMDKARLRIVALTANAFAEDRVAARRAGIDDFLAKPLNRARLVAFSPGLGGEMAATG